MRQRIASLFSEKLNLEVPGMETDLIETGILDSMTFVTLLAELEQEFDVRIPVEDLEVDNFRSLASIETYVSRLKASSQATSPKG